jgi:hypothetical protein
MEESGANTVPFLTEMVRTRQETALFTRKTIYLLSFAPHNPQSQGGPRDKPFQVLAKSFRKNGEMISQNW